MMDNYLKENNVKVKDGSDVNSIMRDMMSIILEGALDQEMDEELGYSKYDYRNKETDNSRNGQFPENHAYQLWWHGNRCPQRQKGRVWATDC